MTVEEMIVDTRGTIEMLTNSLQFIHKEELRNEIRVMLEKKEIWLQKLLDGKITVKYGD